MSETLREKGARVLTLLDRGYMIGQAAIAHGFTVDPAEAFLEEPKCAAFVEPLIRAWDAAPKDSPARVAIRGVLQEGMVHLFGPIPEEQSE